VSGGSGKIGSVAIIRQDPQTHNWGWGNRYVKLWHKEIEGGRLIIQAPAVPGLAVPGYYMLFAVSEEGVPSVANLVQLRLGWSVPKEEGAWLDHHQ
jgi:galactose oxidase